MVALAYIYFLQFFESEISDVFLALNTVLMKGVFIIWM